MAGHSKWANIQHRKKAQDAKRGKLFTRLIREIMVAAKAGGSDQDSNPILASQLDLGSKADWTAFTVWLSALLYARGDQIVRIKGVVCTPAGRLLLQTVRQSVQSPEILPDLGCRLETDNTIAVIGRGFTQGQLAKSLAHFTI